MGFIQGSVAEAKFVGNDAFPKPLLPAPGSNRNLAESVVAEREPLVAALRQHRALLFRGFDVASVDDFERVVEAFQWDGYKIVPDSTTRAKLSERIYRQRGITGTVHQLPPRDAPGYFTKPSFGRPTRPPSKVFFCCSEPSPEGGETAIVASDVIVEKMEEKLPEFMAKVAKVGLLHGNKIASNADVGTPAIFNRTWKMFLGTDDEVEAEKRDKETLACSAVHFFSDGSAELIIGPTNPVVEREGKRAWIVPILGYTDNINTVTNRFGDGSAIPSEVFGIYEQLLEENCVDIKWQKGDVMLLDNFVVQHARRPGKPPRRVLASMCH